MVLLELHNIATLAIEFLHYPLGELCWARDPPTTMLGIKAHILIQFCNPNVKTPHFVVAEHVDVKES